MIAATGSQEQQSGHEKDDTQKTGMEGNTSGDADRKDEQKAGMDDDAKRTM